jgi:DNA-binding NtrC family response regulator
MRSLLRFKFHVYVLTFIGKMVIERVPSGKLSREHCMKFVLVATRFQDALQSIRQCFDGPYSVEYVDSKEKVMQAVGEKRHGLLFMDVDILLDNEYEYDCNYKEILKPLWCLNPYLEIVLLSTQEDLRKAVMLVKAGARNYLTHPVREEEVNLISEQIVDSIMMESELGYLRDKFWQIDSLNHVRTDNQQMKKVFEQIRSVSPTKSTVLLTGETGTGKSLMAKLIHQHSNRSDDQFISVHCGAIPDTLIESELFGHEKGAFTGALKRKLGKFEIANDGTIFLDEIGTITKSAQIKLLQILQDGAFQRLGGEETLAANVRIIAATNSNLKEMTYAGEFRRDLFYRLNVFPIEIPPLRERLQDIGKISETILDRLNRFESKYIHGIDQRVLDAFQSYSWPGNIRELENLIERAYILETSSLLTPESFPAELFHLETGNVALKADSGKTLAEVRRSAIEDIERSYIRELLSRNQGKINISASEAGVSTRQLNKLMNRYDIHKEAFKMSS